LHKKHEGLIAKVDVEIKNMSKNGEIEKIANFPFRKIN